MFIWSQEADSVGKIWELKEKELHELEEKLSSRENVIPNSFAFKSQRK